MSIPFLSYLEATTASVDNALHAYSRRWLESAIGSIMGACGIVPDSTGVPCFLSRQGL